MKLVYSDTQKEVNVNDRINVSGRWVTVYSFDKPHKSSSQGKVTVKDGVDYREYYVSVIGAEWIKREDRK